MRTSATNQVSCANAHARLTEHFLKPRVPGLWVEEVNQASYYINGSSIFLNLPIHENNVTHSQQQSTATSADDHNFNFCRLSSVIKC